MEYKENHCRKDGHKRYLFFLDKKGENYYYSLVFDTLRIN